MPKQHPEEPASAFGLPEDAAPQARRHAPAESGVSGLGAPEREALRRDGGRFR